MTTQLELISFKTCPFVQRSVIVLLEKKLSYKISYIDLANKPDWFLSISPTGKVPLLKVGDTVLFESAIINEYLDEVYPPHMQVTDPLQKAQDRAWIEFSSALFMMIVKMTSVETKAEFVAAQEEFIAKAKQVEQSLSNKPYYHGDHFGLVDIAFAPCFMRIQYLESFHAMGLLESLSKMSYWSEQVCQRDSVKNSVVPEFAELLLQRIKAKNSYFSQLLA